MADHERTLLRGTPANQTFLTAVVQQRTLAETAAENAGTSEENAGTSAATATTKATESSHWAEGTDEQVAALGGEKSSKTWAGEAKDARDDAVDAKESLDQLGLDVAALQTNVDRALRAYRDVNVENAGRSLATSDHGCLVVLSSAANHQFTLQALTPASSFRGHFIDFTADGNGVPEVIAGQDVTLTAPEGSGLKEPGLLMRAIHLGNNAWIIDGSTG